MVSVFLLDSDLDFLLPRTQAVQGSKPQFLAASTGNAKNTLKTHECPQFSVLKQCQSHPGLFQATNHHCLRGSGLCAGGGTHCMFLSPHPPSSSCTSGPWALLLHGLLAVVYADYTHSPQYPWVICARMPGNLRMLKSFLQNSVVFACNLQTPSHTL